MKWMRAGILVLLLGAATWFVQAHLTIEDELVHSIEGGDAAEAALFERFHTQSPFEGKLFVEMGGLSEAERRDLTSSIAAAGYRRMGADVNPVETLRALVQLAPAVLDEAEIQEAVAPPRIAARAREIVVLASLPGASALFETLAQDPLGFASRVREAVSRVFKQSLGEDQSLVEIYQSPEPLSYERVAALYDRWVGLANQARAISGDFFALANYRAVRRDIVECTVIALPLNFLLFWVFVRSWRFLAFLCVGSIVSYAAGLFTLSVSAGPVFTLVFVFTSTFVSFNNEYLVHLCGLDPSRSDENKLSLGSAIGTTFIGFLALLFARSVLIKQIALVTLGGMAGFLAFLFIYRDVLSRIHLRVWRWPMLSIGSRGLLAGSIVVLGILACCGLPTLRTRVESFGVMDDLLRREAEYFGAKSDRLAGKTILAVEAREPPERTWASIEHASRVEIAAHPLMLLRSAAEQERNVRLLDRAYTEAVQSLQAQLEASGVRLPMDATVPTFGVQDATRFLRRSAGLWPSPAWIEQDGTQWLVVGVLDADVDKAESALAGTGARVLVLNPRTHYDRLLTGVSEQLLVLFVVGLAAVAAYLIVLQRRLLRLLYIAFPLAVALALFLMWLRSGGPYEVNFVHLTAFVLVMSLAVDYSCIAVSSGFGELERTKILVTGLSTLASFATLMVAHHPVLRDIGKTVTLGCAVSLVFALFFRLKEDA